MTDVLVAVDDTAAAEPVLRTGLLIAQSLGRPVHVLHAGEPNPRLEELAHQYGLAVDFQPGPAETTVPAAVADPQVEVVVVGLHGLPGHHRTGHLVPALASQSRVPVVIVPASAAVRGAAGRVMFPLDGTQRISAGARPLIAAYVAAGIDVIALHVYDPKTVPRFHDGPEDDAVWRDEFLAQHCADLEIQLTTRPGPLVPAVLEVAASQDVDIIALPTRGDTAGIADSFVHEVLTSADRPVALVPVPRTPMVAERSA